MKIKSALVLLFLGFTLALNAQVASDPFDFFYTDLAIWETSGLVNNLPAARPYPLQLVKEILRTVIEKGDADQRKNAQAHYARFFGRIVTLGGKSEAVIDTAESRKQIAVAIAFKLNYEIEDYLTASGSMEGWATNKLPSMEVLPAWQKSVKDIVEDNAKIGPFWILPSIDSSVAVGTTEYYLNAGLMRGTYGPFQSNGVIVGSQALHSGQYSFAVNKSKWGFNLSLYSLTADNGYAKKYIKEAPPGAKGNWYPEKYLSVHSFDYRPFDWLSVSFLESIMFGGRLDLMYLLPMAPYLISQSQTGFVDNSYLGGMFTVKPIKGLKIDGVLYADDLSFNDIAHLKFDTKWRLAGQLGTSYVPRKSGIFTIASIDYTMITPYTYSHKNGDPLDLSVPNYQNYLHADNSFGAALDPNSDRINLKITMRPLEGVDFDLVGIMIRHGNVNEGMDAARIKEYLTVENTYITDGTILNSSGTDSGHAFNYSTPFLTQDTIQYIWQTGFDAVCRLPVLKTGGYMVFRFGYRFECNINDGINSRVYTYDETLGITATDADIAAAAAAQLSAWKHEATGTVFNNYISAGFEYYY